LLKVYNTLTRKIESFELQEGKEVKMYSCGPSTYQLAHIGNYRTFLFEDILQRYLEYLGYNVRRLMTLTDVEDKAVNQAKKENLTVEELTQRSLTIFFRDFELLKIKKPDYPVKASTAVNQATDLIIELVRKGTAYKYLYRGSAKIYFDPLKFSGFGKLSHLDMNKWPRKKRRFHKDTYPGTPWNRGDFVLWHGCTKDDVCYQTSIGMGRPSWNIQDAAIVTKHLGFCVDVACGGIDNLVRHHDYTLAVAEAVSERQFSKYWLHGGHLFVDGKKMSKSKGNVYSPNDLLSKGFSGQHVRFFLIYGPYRKKLNFTFNKLSQTSQKLDSFKHMISDLEKTKPTCQTIKKKMLSSKIVTDFEVCLNADLDVKSAFDNIYQTIRELHEMRQTLSEKEIKNVLSDLHKIDSVLQCIF
jgi:cysteinyl-tRNA synthetase